MRLAEGLHRSNPFQADDIGYTAMTATSPETQSPILLNQGNLISMTNTSNDLLPSYELADRSMRQDLQVPRPTRPRFRQNIENQQKSNVFVQRSTDTHLSMAGKVVPMDSKTLFTHTCLALGPLFHLKTFAVGTIQESPSTPCLRMVWFLGPETLLNSLGTGTLQKLHLGCRNCSKW